MICQRMTGAWDRSGDREVWTGVDGPRQVRCGYEGGPHIMLCHLIVTHRIPLAEARTLVGR